MINGTTKWGFVGEGEYSGIPFLPNMYAKDTTTTGLKRELVLK